MKIIAFGASHSKKSINKQLATYVAHQFNNDHIEVLDLNDYTLPIYTTDLEQESGFPDAARAFLQQLEGADLIIVSLAEHNGSYTAGFKNLFDWVSRIKVKMFENKKILLLATSPGAGGAKFVLEAAETRFPRHGASIVGSFSLPFFKENFSKTEGVLDEDLAKELNEIIQDVLL
jgi:NAD(P)H-dependent FMN reductase